MAATVQAAGDPRVLDGMKRLMGLLPAEDRAARTVVVGPGADWAPVRADSPLMAEHERLTDLLASYRGKLPWMPTALGGETEAARVIAGLDAAGRGRVWLTLAERRVLLAERRANAFDYHPWEMAADQLLRQLVEVGEIAFDRDGAFDAAVYGVRRGPNLFHGCGPRLVGAIAAAVDRAMSDGPPLTEGERYVAALLRGFAITEPPLGEPGEAVDRLTRGVGDGLVPFLVPGEPWADGVNADLGAVAAKPRAAWVALLRHWLTATAAKPSDKWLATAGKLAAAVGAADVAAAVGRWLPLFGKGRPTDDPNRLAYHYDRALWTMQMVEGNETILRGLVWSVPGLAMSGGERLLSGLAAAAFRKLPGVGPRSMKVGNAAVFALSRIGTAAAVGQLAVLKAKVKTVSAQKEIGKAFDATAAALGLPRDEVEELGVPAYGLEDVGVRRETFGEFTGELRVDGRDVAVRWTDAAGKPRKAVPAAVKAEHKEPLKELTDAAKDVAAMLPAQAGRLDALFAQDKRWPAAAWRERYLDHPLVGTLARRLIWTDGQRSFAWAEGKLVNVDDATIELPTDAAVGLWHPIGRSVAEVVAWRAWVERHGVRQPFKQAHREVYVLTDAERRTNTYSNRFAGHVLRQHQFNALAAARAWRHKARLMVDDTYPPATRELPAFGLRAEYWVEGVGDDFGGDDTTAAGTYLRLSTDQVRFYRSAAAANRAQGGVGQYTSEARDAGEGGVNEPVPLEAVPPLAFSEAMRDVDLFVGVASVGNDPTWQDGGPGGRYRAYWNDYSFGDLSATAQTRRDVLARLVPRLKIADRCTLAEKFLVVRGNRRTYKIHLGSGNILMEPNDQYLCIVPDAAAEADRADVSLPFEGDRTLSIILSKAFLLAADDQIKDETITRQIGGR